MATETRQFITVREMAEALGVSPGHVYRLIARGRLPGAPVAGVIRVPRVAWQRWMSQQTETALAGLEAVEVRAGR